MPEAGANVPLLLRTAQNLRERFTFLRNLGPVVAVMEESPPGPVECPNAEPGRPDELPFPTGQGQRPRRYISAAVEREGRVAAARSLWFGAEPSTVDRILRLCRDANGFVPFVRRTYGLSPDCGTTLIDCRWIWTVFELAETRPPFTVLALGGLGEVFRRADSGCSVAERFIAAGGESPGLVDPVFEMLRRQTFRPQRYWQLDDLAEASIAVMDLIEVAIPSLAGSDESQAAAVDPRAELLTKDEVRKALAEAVAPKKDRKPRGETTCERLRDLHVNIDPDFAETAPEPKLGKRIERSPGSFPYSHYWVTVLRPKRQKVRAEILEAKRKAREAQRWGHFDSVGGTDEDFKDH